MNNLILNSQYYYIEVTSQTMKQNIDFFLNKYLLISTVLMKLTILNFKAGK